MTSARIRAEWGYLIRRLKTTTTPDERAKIAERQQFLMREKDKLVIARADRGAI